MRELTIQETEAVAGGNKGYPSRSNDSLSATLVRNAGLGAMGGAIAGPKGAIVGAAMGLFYGFNEYYG